MVVSPCCFVNVVLLLQLKIYLSSIIFNYFKILLKNLLPGVARVFLKFSPVEKDIIKLNDNVNP